MSALPQSGSLPGVVANPVETVRHRRMHNFVPFYAATPQDFEAIRPMFEVTCARPHQRSLCKHRVAQSVEFKAIAYDELMSPSRHMKDILIFHACIT